MSAAESKQTDLTGKRLRVGPQPPLDMNEWSSIPFSPADTYEEERERRIRGIRAFRNLEEQIVRERASAGTDSSTFSPDLVYTVIEEERERERRIKEVDTDEASQRRKSAAVTRKAEEEERKRRIREAFEEEVIDRKESARVTRSLEDKEREERTHNTTVENRRRESAYRFTRTHMRDIRSRKSTLKKTDRGREIMQDEWRQKFDRNPIRERAITIDQSEDEERNRRIQENRSNDRLNEFKAKEISKMIVNEIKRRNLALKS